MQVADALEPLPHELALLVRPDDGDVGAEAGELVGEHVAVGVVDDEQLPSSAVPGRWRRRMSASLPGTACTRTVAPPQISSSFAIAADAASAGAWNGRLGARSFTGETMRCMRKVRVSSAPRSWPTSIHRPRNSTVAHGCTERVRGVRSPGFK